MGRRVGSSRGLTICYTPEMATDAFQILETDLAAAVAKATKTQDVWEAFGYTCGCGGVLSRFEQAIAFHGLSTAHWTTPL
jgi:hypothetical protein